MSSLPAAAQDLLVAAASDLARSTDQIVAAFQKATGSRAVFTLGSSGMLARQIENGAPFDVFLSANVDFLNDLIAKGHIERDSMTVYASGLLGLWSRTGSVRTLDALKQNEIRYVAIANPVHAPYGLAARKALESAGVWKPIEPKLVLAENVRQALAYAETGSADVAITAWALIHDRGGAAIPAHLYPPIVQAGGVVARTERTQDARRFLAFLTGPEGRRILVAGGFLPPPG